jgi:hypothetical protein
VRLLNMALLLGVLLAGIGYGRLAGEHALPPFAGSGDQALAEALAAQTPPGRWRPAPARADAAGGDQAVELHALQTIGYAAGYEPAPGTSGVTVHDRSHAEPGLNLCNSGHEQAAWLMDMDGRVLHRWSYDLRPLLSDEERVRFDEEPWRHNWRRVHAGADGSLLAIYEGDSLIKLDHESNLLWRHRGGEHHDLHVNEDGSLYVLGRAVRRIGRIDLYRQTLEDFILVLDADGVERRRVSVLEALERSPWAPLLARRPEWGDITHTNTIERLDGRLADRLPAFAEGNVLISLRELDAIAVVDLRAGEVVWALAGLFRAQHQPTVLENGHLLLFDNRGLPDRSRVLEFDPLSQGLAWSFEAPGFQSLECGSAQRLRNGNTLITETDSGRAFEVTSAGEIVWEFVNPHRAGEQGELIAALFEVVRLPSDFAEGWLARE